MLSWRRFARLPTTVVPSLRHLLSRLRAGGVGAFRIPKVHPAEVSDEWLQTIGFRAAGAHRLYAATAEAQ